MKKLESENSLVVRANQLIEAKYRLTATEQKIIYILTAMVHKDDKDFKPYIMRIDDLMALIETDSHSKYNEVKAICRNLMKKVFTIHDIAKKEEIMVNWFSSVNYKYGKGFVEFEFSPYLKPLMLQLKSSFTKFNLNNVRQIRSGYSLRLYELLKQYEKIGRREFNITQLRELIGILQKEYPLYADFKKRVLIQAQKEINAKTDITFEFKEIKEGKKVIAIEFKILPVVIIESEPKKQLPPVTTEASPTLADIEAIKDEFRRLYKGELVDRFVKQMLGQKGLAHVQECLRVYKDYIQGQAINNIGGHFKTFVMSGYVKPVPHNGKDVITAPKHETFRASEEEAEEMKAFYADAEKRREKRSSPEVAQAGLQSLRSLKDIMAGKIKEMGASGAIPEDKE